VNLQEIVRSASAIRLRQRLLPEGGPGDKVFPPTFASGNYCWEQRRIDGQSVPCVLLDSVASQANRFEEALADLVANQKLELPRLIVRFEGDLADLGAISTLAAPHRVFDAILRDSALKGEPFFKSTLYKELTACNIRNATALFAHAPTALLFGCWDSTGAAGGLGNKFARAITSEMVGINAEWGTTQGGVRQDPLGISSDVEIAIDASGDWSLVGKSTAGKKDRAKGTRPSEINHGNVLVKVDVGSRERELADGSVQSQRLPLKGGVTLDHALQTTVLSLAALRRLRFPLTSAAPQATDECAQEVLAALALVAITASRDRGYWLRSRCGLVPDGMQDFEIVKADGTATILKMDSAAALDAYRKAVGSAKEAGLPWHAAPVELTPRQNLVDLVRKSREIQSLSA
jgi:CRISPR-associated protein Csb1